MTATVCFCHGRESGPWGTKIRRLAQVAEHYGCRVISADDRDIQDPDERVRRLLAMRAELVSPLILVGSSMGGYVAAVVSAELRPVGLFLMAPAVSLPGYRCQEPQVRAEHVSIVHGWDDTVVPPDKVLAFARRQRATLHLFADDHLLKGCLEQVAALFAEFLASCLGHKVRPPTRELLAAL